MRTDKIFRIPFLLIFFCLLSFHVNAKTKKVHGELNIDGSPHNYDDTYNLSGGNITFKLTEMPCGVPMFWIRAVAVPGNGGNYNPRNFTSEDLNKDKVIGKDVNAINIHQFRIQTWIQGYDNKANCKEKPSFKGELNYVPYAEPPNCKKGLITAIVVPIVTAIIGALGGIIGALTLQRRRNIIGINFTTEKKQ